MMSKAIGTSWNLRVLFAVREDLFTQPGGDTIQIANTATALRRRGVDVVTSSDAQIALDDFECVHLWHLERVHETYVHLLNAKRAGKPIVLSPIYWPRRLRLPDRGGSLGVREQPRQPRYSLWEDVKNVWRFVRARSWQSRRAVAVALRHGWVCCRREALEAADVLLPNSRAEAEILEHEVGKPLHCQVVPNGVRVETCREERERSRGHERRGIVCVGHFDPRKNQLRLIRALQGADVPITFVGHARPMHQA